MISATSVSIESADRHIVRVERAIVCNRNDVFNGGTRNRFRVGRAVERVIDDRHRLGNVQTGRLDLKAVPIGFDAITETATAVGEHHVNTWPDHPDYQRRRRGQRPGSMQCLPPQRSPIIRGWQRRR